MLLLGFMALSPALAIDYSVQGQAQTQPNQGTTGTTPDQTQTQDQTTPVLPNTATTPSAGLSSSVIMWVIIGLLAVVVIVALVAIASRGSTNP